MQKKKIDEETKQAKGNLDGIYKIYNSSDQIFKQEFSNFQIEHYKFIKIFLYLSYLFDIISKSFSCELSQKLDFLIVMIIILGLFFILITASLFFLNKYSKKNILDRVLGNSAILVEAYFLLYCLIYLSDVHNETKLRGFFSIFIFSLAEILFAYEINLLNNLLILTLNAAVSILFCVLAYNSKKNHHIITFQIVVLCNMFLIMAFAFKIKNADFIEKKFKENLKLNWSENYANDYMNNLNSHFFILKDNKVKKVNEKFIDYLFSPLGIERNNIINSDKNNFVKDNKIIENEFKKNVNNLVENIDSDSNKRKNQKGTGIEKHLFLKNSNKNTASDNNPINTDLPEEVLFSLSEKFLKLLKPLKINQDLLSEKENEENCSRNLFSQDNSIKFNKNNKEFSLNPDFMKGNVELNLFSIVSNLKYNLSLDNSENNLNRTPSDFIYLGVFTKHKLDPISDKSFFEAFETKIKNFNKGKDINLITNSNTNNKSIPKNTKYDENYKKTQSENLLMENVNAEELVDELYSKSCQPNNKILDELENKKNIFLKDNEVLLNKKYFQVFVRVYRSKDKLGKGKDTLESQNSLDILLYDITDLKQNQEIEFILKAKFFAKLAHEFKTPLNGILGLIRKIQYGYKNEESKNSLKKMIKNDLFQIENLSNYVLFLINDIIEYSNIHNENCQTRSFDHSNSNNICASENKNANAIDNNNQTNNLILNKTNDIVCPNIINDFSNKSNLNNSNKIDSNNKKTKSIFLQENSIGNNNHNEINNNNKTNKSCEFTNIYNKNNNKTHKSNFIVNINYEKINLKEILNFCKDVTNTLLISRGKEKSIKTKVDFDNAINSLDILSDCFRVKQILLNFLSNSVKFTKKGEITIKAAIANFSRGNIKITISIIDSGIGIKKEELELIFKENTMLTAAKEFNFMGTGLGLSIARNIAAKLNHEIEVSSEYGKGSEFRLVLYCIQEENVNGNNLNFNKNNNENLIKNIGDNNNDNISCFKDRLNFPNKSFNNSNLLTVLNCRRWNEKRDESGINFVDKNIENIYKRNIVFEEENNSASEENERFTENQKILKIKNNNDHDDIKIVLKKIENEKEEEKDDIVICNENIENQIIQNNNALKECTQNDLNKIIDEVPRECYCEKIPTRCFDINDKNKWNNKKLNKKIFKENLESEYSSSEDTKNLEHNKFSNNNYDKVFKNKSTNFSSSNCSNKIYTINNNTTSNQSSDKNRILINKFASPNSSFYRKSSENSSIMGDSQKTVVLDDSEIFRLDFDNSKNLFEEIEKIRSNNQSIFFSAINNFNINCNKSENNNVKISLKSNSSSDNNKMDSSIFEQNTNNRSTLNYNSENNTNSYCLRIKNHLKFNEDYNSDAKINCTLDKLSSSSSSCQRGRKKLSKFSVKKQTPEKSQKNKILIADDQTFIRSALRYLVEKILEDTNKISDFEIVECCDGIDILNEIIKDQYINNTIKCVLTDENMEYLNGSNTIKILRDMQYSNKIKKVPIACLTAYEDSFNKELIFKAGVDLILSKPCTEKSVMKFFEDFKVLQS